MKLNIAVCDDDILFLNSEYEIIKSVFDSKHIPQTAMKFNNPQDMIDSDTIFDMAFLDIEMDNADGIEVARKITERNDSCFIFFITNYPIYLDNALDVSAFRFLTKPLDKKRLTVGIDSALNKINEKNKILSVTNHKNKITADVLIASILYIENYNRHTRIVTTDTDFTATETYAVLKEKISSEVDFFIESSQSIFVNLKYVTNYDKSVTTVEYGGRKYRLNISRRKYKSFDEKMFKLAGTLR